MDVTELAPLSGEADSLHKSIAKRLLVVSLVVTLDKSSDRDRTDRTDEVLSILHEKSFNLDH